MILNFPFLIFLLFTIFSCSSATFKESKEDESWHTGDVPVCDVINGSGQEQLFEQTSAFETGNFSERGPYPIWNNSPEDQCSSELITPENTLFPGTQLFITYPVKQWPTVTGIAEISDGTFPVLLFSHANNGKFCRLYKNYKSIMNHLSSWGFIVVSINSETENCQPSTSQNLRDRADRMHSAIVAIELENQNPDSIFYQKFDMTNLFISGHSRGGGAAMIVLSEIPDSIAGIVTFMPVDHTKYGFGSLDSETPAIIFSAELDTDLEYPYVEKIDGQFKGIYSFVTINGGIHAYTTDTLGLRDEDSPKINRDQQHDIIKLYTTAFLLHSVGNSPEKAREILFTFSGNNYVFDEISKAGVFTFWNNPEENTIFIDDFQGNYSAQPFFDTNLTGGLNISYGFKTDREVSAWYPDNLISGTTIIRTLARQLVPIEDGEGILLLEAAIELESDDEIFLHFAVKRSDAHSWPENFELTIHTDTGDFTYSLDDYTGPLPVRERMTQAVIPLTDLPDSSRISSISFAISDGGVFIDNIRLTQSVTENDPF